MGPIDSFFLFSFALSIESDGSHLLEDSVRNPFFQLLF